MNTIKIGNITAQPGSKKFGYLRIDEATTLRTFQFKTVIGPPRQRSVMIPIMVVNGSQKGPTLCINAGVHATEYSGIVAVIRLYKEINPTELEGTLLLIPVVNPASFWTMTPYVNIQDGVDISTVYGVEGDTVSYLIANEIMNEIFVNSDLVIDFHAGDLLEDLLPHCGFTKVGNKDLDEKSEMFAKTFGLEYVHESETKERKGRYLLDIPQIYVEIGCCGKLEEKNVDCALKGIFNIMKKMKMINGKPSTPKKIKILQTGDYIYASYNGIFNSKAEVGDKIKKGQLLGEIYDLQGRELERIIAPSDGIIFLKMYNPVKLAGDLIYKCIK
jgi:predicted deacylase